MIALAFDEVLGIANIAAGHPGMTARLTIHYRKPTPLFRDLRFLAGLDRVEGRRIMSRAEVWDGETLTAEAEGSSSSPAPSGPWRSSAPILRTGWSDLAPVRPVRPGAGSSPDRRMPIPEGNESMLELWVHRSRLVDRVPEVRGTGRGDGIHCRARPRARWPCRATAWRPSLPRRPTAPAPPGTTSTAGLRRAR